MRPRTQILGVAVLSGAVTAAVAVSDPVRYAYHEPDLHIVIATAGAVIAAMAALLVVGRFHSSGSLDDLLLASALALFAGINLGFGVLPSSLGEDPIDSKWVWAAVSLRALSAILLAAAALVPTLRLVSPRKTAAVLWGAVAAFAVVCTTLFGALGSALPPGREPMLSTAGAPRFSENGGFEAVLLATAVCFGLAAVGFARKAERTRDAFTLWVATAAVLAAFARVNYAMYPSRYTDWVYFGDIFEFLACAGLLVAAAYEMGRYWKVMSLAAVTEERQRLAHDLHDGLAQELALIRRWVEQGPRGTGEVAAGAERAMAETRATMFALSGPLDEPLSQSLVRAAEETAGRLDASVSFDVDERATTTVPVRDALFRITCDAIADAAGRREAHAVRIQLSADDDLLLLIIDDGTAIEDAGRDKQVVRSMQRRAEHVGAQLNVVAAPSGATVIEVRLES